MVDRRRLLEQLRNQGHNQGVGSGNAPMGNTGVGENSADISGLGWFKDQVLRQQLIASVGQMKSNSGGCDSTVVRVFDFIKVEKPPRANHSVAKVGC